MSLDRAQDGETDPAESAVGIVTVADFIRELQLCIQSEHVFLFDGAETFRIEVRRVTHRSHDPYIWITKAHDPEMAQAALVRQLTKADLEIGALYESLSNNRQRLKELVEFRATLGRCMERAK